MVNNLVCITTRMKIHRSKKIKILHCPVDIYFSYFETYWEKQNLHIVLRTSALQNQKSTQTIFLDIMSHYVCKRILHANICAF